MHSLVSARAIMIRVGCNHQHTASCLGTQPVDQNQSQSQPHIASAEKAQKTKTGHQWAREGKAMRREECNPPSMRANLGDASQRAHGPQESHDRKPIAPSGGQNPLGQQQKGIPIEPDCKSTDNCKSTQTQDDWI